MERECNTCYETKPDTEFPRNSRSLRGRLNKCKPCSAEYARNYRKDNPLKYKAQKYNTTEEHLAELFEAGTCAICGTDGAKYIDHCHDSEKVRGILCNECNVGLGMFKDNPELLKEAVNYLGRNNGD